MEQIPTKALLSLVMGGMVLGCSSEPTSPGAEDPFAAAGSYEPAIDFQEGDLVLGEVVFTSMCKESRHYREEMGNGWDDEILAAASHGPMTVDLYFPYGPFEGPKDPVPWPEDSQAVLDAGGEIVRESPVSVVRARLTKEAMDELADYPRLNHARAVARPDRLDIRLSVGAVSQASEAEVRDKFQQLGGHIVFDGSIPAFRGVIASDSVPALRAMGMGTTIEYIQLEIPRHFTCVIF